MQSAVRPRRGPVSPARLDLARRPSCRRARPANGRLIEHLLAAGMYDDAIGELRRLQATGQGSPLVDATIAYALNRQGKLRPAITAMRRAYPQFMADGGEALPQEILTVIFPIDHWELIQRSQAAAKKLDPYLRRGARRAGIDVPGRHQVGGQRVGPDADRAGHGPAVRATLGIRPFSTDPARSIPTSTSGSARRTSRI